MNIKTAVIAAALSLVGGSALAGGSVYDAYKPTAFVRGGYAFEGDASGDFAGSIGYRNYFGGSQHRFSHLGWEAELIVDRNSAEALGIEYSEWLLAALLGLRWQFDASQHVRPFLGASIGPGYAKAKLTSGGVTVDRADEVTFVYSARAGFEVIVSERFSFEPAYRFIGTSQSGTPMTHAAELGLNLKF